MPVITLPSYLEIASIPLATPAWVVLDLLPLLDGTDVRGSDRLLPGVNGVKPYRRRNTVSVRTLELVIFGDEDQEGEPYSNHMDGLELNILYLRDNLLAPEESGDGTVSAVLHLTGGSVLTADVHVLPPLKVRQVAYGMARGVLDISIPAGEFSGAYS